MLAVDRLSNHRRQVRAFERILRTSRSDAEFETKKTVPFVTKRELTRSDALLAQFELICSDVISVFIVDAVLSNAEPGYLARVYRGLIQSDEFKMVAVSIDAIPGGVTGNDFVQQFIADETPPLRHRMIITQKKARIMSHWARKIGVSISKP